MKKTKLGSIITIKKGKKHSIEKFPDNRAKRLITIEDLRNNSNFKYTNDLKGPEVIPTDIIIVWDGANSGLIGNGLEGFIGSTLARLRIKDSKKISSTFLTLFLKSQFQYLKKAATGAAIPHINRIALENLTVPDLGFEDQTRIAILLSKVESLIARRKKTIADLDVLLKSIFLEMFGDPVRNEMGWEKIKIGEIASIRIGPFGSLLHAEDYVKDGIPLINPSNMVDGKIVPDKNLSLSQEKYKELKNYHLERNDVVVARRGEIGRCAIVETDSPLFCGTGSMFVRITKKYYPIFLQFQIYQTSLKDFLESKSKGVTMKNLNSKILSQLKVLKPPFELQTQFINTVEKVEALKEKYQNSLNDLGTLYGALSQKAFKGELDFSRIPIPKALKPKDISMDVPQVEKPDLADQDEPVKTTETREQILHRLFHGFISDAKTGALSLDDFWRTAEEAFTALLDEEASPLGAADYDRVRDWLFDLLAKGSVVQVFNEEKNRMEIRPVS